MFLKRLFLLCLFLFTGPAAFSSPETDSLLQELSSTLAEKDRYIQEKYDQIGQLRQALKSQSGPAGRFRVYDQLHAAYRTFKYDSAFAYARKLQHTARQLRDPVKITYARVKLSFTLLSTGMYKEAIDSLESISPKHMPDSIRLDYYAVMARAYYDLSGYTQDTYYTSRYAQTGETYVDSALALLEEKDMRFFVLRGMKREIAMEPEKARQDFQFILDRFRPSLNQYAMAANSLGNIYYKRGEADKAIALMARAAIADIRASVKEGVALMTLADFLYHNGEESRAYAYIKQALADADFFGAKQRKIQVAAILPVIEGEQLATMQEQRTRLFIYATAVTLLSVLVVIFAGIIFRQLRQLRQAKKTVTEAYGKLQEINDKLLEANRIKEEYIGYSFNFNSEYLDKVEKFKNGIDKKLMAKKYDEIGHVMKTINLKKEREALYLSFDKIFLRLFPNFVSEFNAYFKEEDKICLKDRDSLNIELRIFALIRLGIHDHEQIARILEYSVNTIYTYKTRVKNRSVLPNEEFEGRIMEIKAF